MPIITDIEVPITVTLPKDLSKQIRERVAAGEYPTEEALVVDFLHDYFDPNWRSDEWVLREVVPVLERMEADPSLALSPEQVRQNLIARHERAMKAR